MTQKDLFEFVPKVPTISITEAVKPKTTFSFLEQICFALRLDQVLAGSMALMVGMAIVYGLGVESGRRIERRNTVVKKMIEPPISRLPARTEPNSALAVEVAGSMKPVTGTLDRAGTASISIESAMHQSERFVSHIKTRLSEKPKGAYTIQLATYKEESIAKKKIQALMIQGLNGFLVPSGTYYLVCVNGFEKRQQAAQSLTRLKSRGVVPKDAYVRAIPA